MSPPPTEVVARERARSGAAPLARLADYVALTRPRILSLVALTVPPAFVLGGGEWPAPAVLVAVILGVTLLGAGSSAINAWWERDRDARMLRTADRPLPQRRLEPSQALGFGIATSAAGAALLAVGGGALAALVGLATLAHYLVVYTVWLKPRSSWSTVVGAIAGAAPPLVADAVDGSFGFAGLWIFAVVFLWQPPHVWAIALYRDSEYAAAGFPMLPRVIGERRARRWMLGFALVLWAVMLVPWIVGLLGIVYGVTASLAGFAFVARIVESMRLGTEAADRAVFRTSLVVLASVLGVALVECALR